MTLASGLREKPSILGPSLDGLIYMRVYACVWVCGVAAAWRGDCASLRLLLAQPDCSLHYMQRVRARASTIWLRVGGES